MIGQSQPVWEYEERKTSLEPTAMLLVRILIAKVENAKRLRSILQQTPIRAGQVGYENWNCVEWLREALDRLVRDEKTLGTATTDWTFVRDTAMWYIEKKKSEHRFDGQVQYDLSKAATWDALVGQESIP